jgi:hypothetical protein
LFREPNKFIYRSVGKSEVRNMKKHTNPAYGNPVWNEPLTLKSAAAMLVEIALCAAVAYVLIFVF